MAKSPGSFSVSSHAGLLPSSGSPPREAEISESGGKVRVSVRTGGTSALGLKVQFDGGAEFNAEPQWFVCFDDKDILHYGVYPKWVNRLEKRGRTLASVSLSGAERAMVFAEVAKALNWKPVTD